LWIRALDSSLARPIAGTENGTYPFWSPDSRSIIFSASGKLKKVAISGGSAESLTDLRLGGTGAWNRDGVVLFTADDGRINRISESGGNAAPVTTLDSSLSERSHFWPQFLPDGKHFLYFAESSKEENSGVYVASLDSKDRKLILTANSNPVS